MKEKKKKSRLGRIFDFRLLPMDLGRLVCFPCPFMFRLRCLTTDGKPWHGRVRGGNIMVSNHIGFLDPFWVGTIFWYRRMFFLTAETVMKTRWAQVLLKAMGCIRIDRNNSDLEAVHRAIDRVKEGRLLTVFAQGHITRDGSLSQIKSGVILIALRSGAPIYPMYSRKRPHWWNRQTVVIGEPFRCSDYCTRKFPSVGDIEHLSDLLLERMEACKTEYEKLKGPAI